VSERQPRSFNAPIAKISAGALAVTILCAIAVIFPIPFLPQRMSSFVQQFSLLIGVNAALVTIGTLLVVLARKRRERHQRKG